MKAQEHKAEFYGLSHDGRFVIGAPFHFRKMAAPGNGCKWAIMATRLGVSATVLERCCNLNFKTKREAQSALAAKLGKGV